MQIQYTLSHIVCALPSIFCILCNSSYGYGCVKQIRWKLFYSSM